MVNGDILVKLHSKIDAGTVTRYQADEYYRGTQPIAFLSPEDAKLLKGRLRGLNFNACKLQVDALVERLRIEGFKGDSEPLHTVNLAWTRQQFQEGHQAVMRECLIHGSSAVIVWGDKGRATISAESSEQVTTIDDPVTHEPTAGIKRWHDGVNTAYSVLFLPHEIITYSVACPPASLIPKTGWTQIDTKPNPLGRVPIVKFTNKSRLLDSEGTPEFWDIRDLNDSAVKLLSDMMVSSELGAKPRRWATGIVIKTDPTTGEPIPPFQDGPNRVWSVENDTARLGQFPSANLSEYISAIDEVIKLISSAAGLPAHYLNTSNVPLSADSIRAQESALVARVESKISLFSRPWSRVAELILQIENQPIPDDIDVIFKDPASRSQAQASDSAQKLYASGIITKPMAQRLAGFSEQERRDMEFETYYQKELDGTAINITG